MNVYDNLVYAALNGNGGGGGGGSLKVGVLRGDAELVQRWTYDKLAVADEGYTIPAYTTTSQTVKESETIEIEIDPMNYHYFTCMRWMSYPVYNASTKTKGRYESFHGCWYSELSHVPSAWYKSAEGDTAAPNEYYKNQSLYTIFRCLYYQTNSQFGISENNSYGVPIYTSYVPAYSTSTHKLTIKTPQMYLRGDSTYFTSTAWNMMTDIRYQYVIELYRLPIDRTDVTAWGTTSQLVRILDAWDSDSKTLT